MNYNVVAYLYDGTKACEMDFRFITDAVKAFRQQPYAEVLLLDGDTGEILADKINGKMVMNEILIW